MVRRFSPLLILALLGLAACAGNRSTWPTLAPRAGEVTTMVPRNVAGAGRCAATADCAPPAVVEAAAPDLTPPPAPPTLAEARAELAAIASLVDQVATAAAPARTAQANARAAAAGSAADSAAASRAEAAESALAAALTPLSGTAFRLQALDLASRTAPDRAAYADQLSLLASRIAALEAP